MKASCRFFVGMAFMIQMAWAGLAYSGHTYETLDFPGARYTEAYGLNDTGQVVGA